MDRSQAKVALDKIIKQIFGVDNPLTLEQAVKKFTFDIYLPNKVKDSTDGSETWSASASATRFIKMENARNNEASPTKGLYASQPIKDLQDILDKWGTINAITTEFVIDGINVAESDMVEESENVFHSRDVFRSKDVYYSDTINDSEFVFASQNSSHMTFCMRAEDSNRCADSFGVTRSGGLTNCFMMHDCGDMQDSMFCSNISGYRFCIANMQFEEAEYRRLQKQVIEWILSPAA